MYGVSKIAVAENVMLIGFPQTDAQFMAKVLGELATAEVVVDMICQTAPAGGGIMFSFTASASYFDVILRTLSNARQEHNPAPMISGGYSKINLFGEEMVDSVGVAARALAALSMATVEISMITTSDLDISLLVRSEDEDVAYKVLKAAYELM